MFIYLCVGVFVRLCNYMFVFKKQETSEFKLCKFNIRVRVVLKFIGRLYYTTNAHFSGNFKFFY